MAKREFIEPCEIVYTNAPIAPILQGDSVHYENIAFKAQIGRIHRLTEQDIIKPYLELLLKEMQSLEEINNSDDRYDKGYQHGRASCAAMVMHMIDNLLSEQGDTE